MFPKCNGCMGHLFNVFKLQWSLILSSIMFKVICCTFVNDNSIGCAQEWIVHHHQKAFIYIKPCHHRFSLCTCCQQLLKYKCTFCQFFYVENNQFSTFKYTSVNDTHHDLLLQYYLKCTPMFVCFFKYHLFDIPIFKKYDYQSSETYQPTTSFNFATFK